MKLRIKELELQHLTLVGFPMQFSGLIEHSNMELHYIWPYLYNPKPDKRLSGYPASPSRIQKTTTNRILQPLFLSRLEELSPPTISVRLVVWDVEHVNLKHSFITHLIVDLLVIHYNEDGKEEWKHLPLTLKTFVVLGGDSPQACPRQWSTQHVTRFSHDGWIDNYDVYELKNYDDYENCLNTPTHIPWNSYDSVNLKIE